MPDASQRRASDPTPGAARSPRRQGLYLGVLAVTVAILCATLPLSRLTGNYLEPPFFPVFQKAMYVQQGLFAGVLLAGLGWLCLRFALPRPVRFALHTAYFAVFGWLSAWALCRKLFGLDLSPLYLWGFLREPGSLRAVGFDPVVFWGTLAATLAAVAGLGALASAAVSRADARGAARVTFCALILLVAVNLPLRAYLAWQIGQGQQAALAFDDAMPFPLRSEQLVPGLRAPRPELPSFETPRRGAAYAAAVRAAAATRIPRPRSIVWLFVECLRTDAITPETMPWLSSARERFEIRLEREHWTGGNSTPYALFSMLSGLGVWQLRTFQDERLTLPFLELLRANGYRLRVGKSSTFDYHGSRRLLPSGTVLARIDGLPLDASDVAMLDRYLDDLRTRPPGLAFDFLSFDATHWHYFFPERDAAFRPFAAADRRLYLERGPAELALVRNRYRNACRFLDGQIRRVVDEIDARGAFADTLVVLAGDHGEALGEHGQMTHSGAIDEVQGRTPVWIHVPGRSPSARTLGMTSHVDLVPTLLDALGFEADVLRTRGRSLLRPAGARTSLVLAEQGYLEPSYHAFVTPHTISRWRHAGGRFLFASVRRRDGSDDPPDPGWLAELRSEAPRAAQLYQVLPDVSQPPRVFATP